MRHATLYRKWRPRRMREISGQKPVVRTLRRAIETGRVAHAYLFSGPRGTGKTSTAKVLAMGLNCEQGPTPEPDGTCESCRAIINNSSLDVVEMDAASNRGIDEIRDLRDKVNLAPVAGRMKVYVVDEVHMLTAEAFNALLKMLEEPPEHVVFVLATTEKHKVLPTIVSRCQSFEFRRPGVPVLAQKLQEISSAEGIEVEPEALTVIAREGRGSFRDAEGLLDQLSSFAEGPITAAMVRELLGSVGSEILLETTAALHGRRAADSLRVVDRLSNEGKDLGRFVGELLGHLRRLMLLPYAPEVALADVGTEERGPLEEQASGVPTAEVVRILESLGDCLGRIKRGGDPKLELELTFLKLCRDYTEPPVENLLRRLEALEAAVENGESGVRPAPKAAPQGAAELAPFPEDSAKGTVSEGDDATQSGEPPETAGSVGDEQEERPAEHEGLPAPEDDDRDDGRGGVVDLASEWGGVIQELKRRRQALTAAVYGEARVEGFDGEVLELVFPEEQGFYVEMAKDRKHADELSKVLEEHVGIRPRLEVRTSGETALRKEPASAPEPEPGLAANPEPVTPEKVESMRGREGSRPPGDEAGDGVIRNQHEVFEMARQRLGSPHRGD